MRTSWLIQKLTNYSITNTGYRMKNLFHSLVVVFSITLLAYSAHAQSITNYTFTASSGTFTEITGGTELPLVSTSTDASVTQEAPIGFDFWYMGVRYTSFFVASDGIVGLLNPSTGWVSTSYGSNNLATGGNRPFLAPFWDDNDMASGYASRAHGAIQYQLAGNVGSRVLTIQWLNVEANWGVNTPVLSMQVRLSESNGSIQFVYRAEAFSPSSVSASIGIQGPTSGNYLSLSNAGTSPLVSSTLETTSINTVPATGQTYTFTPGTAPNAPSAINFTSVTVNGMTVNWTDNSSNENGFALYASRDGGTTYQFMGTVAANITTFSISGLEAGTYLWRVHAFNETIGTPATATQATTTGTLSGTYTVGPTGNYTSLTSALSALTANAMSGSVILELQSNYNSATETYPLVLNRRMASSRTQRITIRPASGATNLSITGSNTTAIFSLDSAIGVTIDGRPGGTGTTSQLTIENTTAGPAIRFINDAQFDTVQYCTIRSANVTATSGTVFFSTALSGTLGSGNNFNVIMNNDIREATSGTTPANGIYNNQTGTNRQTWNRGNIISNNNIYNFFNATATPTGGILLQAGYTNWTITGNSIYQTATRTPTSTVQTYYGIGALVTTTTGGAVGMNISDNFVGGSSPNCGGSAYTMTGSSNTTTFNFIGIQHAHGMIPASLIANNTIRNIAITTASTQTTTGGFCGINVGYSNASVFASQDTVANNTIGSGTGNGSISVTFNNTSATVPQVIGIQTGGSSEGARYVITNNTIGSINASHAVISNAVSIIGISVVSTCANNTISGNTIGSTTTANSINFTTSSTSTSTTVHHVDGIRNANNNSRYIQTIANNIIANLNSNSSTTTSGTSGVRGIVATSGICSITDNTIRNLSTTTNNPASSTASAINGIIQTSTTAPADFSPTGRGQVCARNTVHSLNLLSTNSTLTTVLPTVLGIFYQGSLPSTTFYTASSIVNIIERNNVHSFGVNNALSSTSTASQSMPGIIVQGGPATVQNNMVRLGIDATGASITRNYQITGIQRSSSSTPNYFKIVHNSVYIGGTQTATTTNPITMGIWKANNPIQSATLGSGGQRDTIMNNIMVNERQGPGFHAAWLLNDTVGTNSNNNLLSPGTTSTTTWTAGYQIGAGYTLFRGMRYWQGVVFPSDNQTIAGVPNFINATGNASAVDLHISNTGSTPIEGNGLAGNATTVQDVDGQTRSSLTPVDIGADAGNFTSAGDIIPPSITYTPFIAGPSGTANRVLSGVAITDASGVNTTAGTRPRIYYKKKSENNAFSAANDNTENGWKWTETSSTSSPFSFTIDYTKLTSATAANDTIQYFVVAQDNASTPNVASATAEFNSVPSSVSLGSAQFPIVLGPPASVREYRISASFSGTYTVGATGATFTSLTNTAGAFDTLNKVILTGNVVLEVTSNLTAEAGTVALNQLVYDQPGTPYTLTIRPASGTTDTISGTFTGGLIRLNGADRVIIDGRRAGETTGRNLTFVNTATTGNVATIQVSSLGVGAGADRDTIRFCNIASGLNTNSTAHCIWSGSATIGTAAVGDNDYLAITDNAVYRSYFGIRVIGNLLTTDSNLIARNIIGAQGSNILAGDSLKFHGIAVSGVNSVTIQSNNIRNISPAVTNVSGINIDNVVNSLIADNLIDGISGIAASTYYCRGIFASTNVTNSSIVRNRINRIHFGNFASSGNWGAYGLEVNTGSQSSNLLIANNMISNVAHDYGGGAGSSFATYGIRVLSSGGLRILNNSVYLRGQYRNSGSTGSSGFSHAIGFISTCTNNDVRNNIFSNRMTGVSGSKAWTFYATSSATFTNLDFNVLDTANGNATQGVIGSNGSDILTLAALQTAFGGNANSTIASPLFVDSTLNADLHLATMPTAQLRGTSAVSSIVSTDFDNLSRSLYIMGADEVKANITYTEQPTGATLCEGNALNLSGTISAPITFDDNISRTGASASYQWLRNGAFVTGATNNTYSVSSVATSDAGTYRLVTYASPIDSNLSNNAVVVVNTNTSITSQPRDTALCAGTNFTVSVSAVGTNLTYQWRRNSNAVSGATNASYTTSASATTYGSYDVVVSGACGNVTSNAVNVTQITPTSISAQPSSTATSLCLGAGFTLTGSGSADNRVFQWRLNGNPISGATNTTYTVTSATLSDFGTYSFTVSGTCGTLTSNNLAITQIPTTVITAQPTATPSSLCERQNFTVSATVVGANLGYQWQQLIAGNWTNITGATNTSYTRTNAQPADFGQYRVNVTGTCGNLTSNPITVTQITTTKIATQPTQPSAICEGSTININNAVAVGEALTYSWQKQSGVVWNTISGATSSSYTKVNAVSADGGNYRLIASGTCYNDTSITIAVTVNSVVQITTQPTLNPTSVCTGETTTMSVAATGTISSYQWQRLDGSFQNISGATNSSYTLTNVQLSDATTFRVILSGPCNAPVNSNGTTLTVQQNIQVTTQPQGNTLCAGNSFTLNAATVGTVVSYQWQQLVSGNWVNISGATNSSYTKTIATIADSGNYRLQILGTCSSIPVNSSNAFINIQTPYTIVSQPTYPSTPTNVGQVVSLTVGVTGSANFQWQRDQFRNGTWISIANATSGTYSYTVNTVADSGNFRCIVSGPCGPGVQNTNAVSVFTCQPPSITQQPTAPQPQCVGGSFTLTASASSPGQVISYQWEKDASRNNNWTSISGATSPSYTITSVVASDDGNYRLRVSTACTATPVYTSVVSVEVRTPVSITQHPASQNVCTGANVSMSVVTTGSNISYQWFFNNAPLTGNSTATNSTLVINSANATHGGTYRCFISSPCLPNGIFSNTATLTVTGSPSITQQPTNQTVCVGGGSATMSVVASGSGLSYQWNFNNSPINGATNSTYVIATPTTANQGNYNVAITSTCGNVTSSSATLTVNTPATIATQPIGQTVCVGSNVTLSTSINGDATSPTYQWSFNGIDIGIQQNPTATSATLIINNAQTSLSGQYRCTIRSACQPNGITTNAVQITVNPATSITTQPQSATVCEGTPASMSVVAVGGNLTYQWRRNTVNIFSATSSTYSIPSVQATDAGSYDVIVGGSCAPLSIVSSAATLVVNSNARITQQPTAQTSCTGGVVTFTAIATGTNLSYQWRRNGQPITDNNSASTNTYTILGVNPSQAGTYDCLVTGTCSPVGVATNTALLTVNSPVAVQTQPQSSTVCSGSPVTFSVVATGTLPTYQWRFNGVSIGGIQATLPSYTITNVLANNAGNYDVVVSNTCNNVTSLVANLTVQQPASIILQPQAQRACVGDNIVLIIGVNGTALGYQWFKDGNAILGANNSSLIITNATSTTSGFYRCVVQGSTACGTAQLTSNNVTIQIGTPTSVTRQPSDKSVSLGSSVSIEVEAEGSGIGASNQLSYAWFRGTTRLVDGGRISGSNTSVLTIRSIISGDLSNDYFVIVTGACGTAQSNRFSLRVPSLTITSQPTEQRVCTGNVITLGVSAQTDAQNAQLTYQWFKGTTALVDGGRISGSQSNLLRISNAIGSDSDSYSVQVSVQPGGVRQTSTAVNVLVNNAPSVVTQPSNTEVCVGENATFTVGASGGGLSYQWQRDGAPINGATNTTLTVSSARLIDAAQYSVFIRNNCGEVTTSNAILTVNSIPTISVQPVGIRIGRGGQFTLSVTATGSGTVTYQWRKGATNIAGATNTTYTMTNLQPSDSSEYSCVVSNGCGSVTSASALVSVSSITGITDAEQYGYSISSPTPNPMGEQGVIRYTAAKSGLIRLTLSDVSGRTVAVLLNQEVEAGEYELNLRASDFNLASGSYRITLTAPNGAVTSKTVIIVR